MPDSLDEVVWIHGAPNCSQTADPLLQVHQYDADTFVLRQSKCFSFEGNFLYVLFGAARVLLLDAGARPDRAGTLLPIRETIDRIINQWLATNGTPVLQLIVAHTHSHGDHVFWDSAFVGRANTTIVPLDVLALKAFYGLADWPDGRSLLDLGGRQL